MMRPLLAITLVAFWPLELVAADWPQFRGPRGDGTADAKDLPTGWGGFGGVAWQTEIPGRGWSSPIVVEGRVWLTTAESLALPTAERDRKLQQGVYKDFAEQFQAHSSVTLYAVEVDAKTGEVLRNIELATVKNPPPIHATNSYASPTPVSDGERLFCHFGPLGTVAMDLKTGELLWKHRFQFDDITGPGSSPTLWKDRLIVPCDGVDQQFVVAIEPRTGEVVWRTPRPKIAAEGKLRRAFSTPLVVEHGGREEAIVPGAEWVCAYDPASGRELWRVNIGEGTHATIPRPVFGDGTVYVCTGYMKPQLWAIRLGGSGDVTETHVAWKHEKQIPEISSPILIGSELYFVSSLGVLSCLDAKSGRELWQHRLGGNFAASPIAADGKLYFSSQEGVSTVLRPGREYVELARNQLIGQTMASPAIAGRSLLIRADRMLYCVGKP